MTCGPRAAPHFVIEPEARLSQVVVDSGQPLGNHDKGLIKKTTPKKVLQRQKYVECESQETEKVTPGCDY